MKILILKSSSLGDVVQALPVLRLLKLHHPSSEIYWWLSAELLPLLKGDADLAGIFPFERRRWVSPKNWDELFQSLREIREHAFDWVIDLQALARSGLVAWLAGGELTIGLEDLREGAAGFYDLSVPRPSYYTHAVDWYLAVLPLLKVPVHWDFAWLPERKEAAAALKQKWHPEQERWIAITPGARWMNKRWPLEFYADLARLVIAHDAKYHVVLLGGKEDRALGNSITQSNPQRCLNLIGETSLPEMIEWIRLSQLMVTNDTGPMHVAAALSKPVVAMFGPTEPRRTGPYGQVNHAIQVQLPCAPCLKSQCSNQKPIECLRAISPSAVFTQIRKRLEAA